MRHYERRERDGTFARTPVHERFLAQFEVDDATGCWLWTGTKNEGGYPYIGPGGRNAVPVGAHRYSWEYVNGPIPDGLQIDHLCRVRHCVNPEHLEAVTPRENTFRSNAQSVLNAAKTHCPRGHPYAGENLYVDNRGERSCRSCKRARDAKRPSRSEARAARAVNQ